MRAPPAETVFMLTPTAWGSNQRCCHRMPRLGLFRPVVGLFYCWGLDSMLLPQTVFLGSCECSVCSRCSLTCCMGVDRKKREAEGKKATFAEEMRRIEGTRGGKLSGACLSHASRSSCLSLSAQHARGSLHRSDAVLSRAVWPAARRR